MRKTISILLLLLVISRCTAFADETSKKIKYMKHGIPRIRTGVEYESVKTPLWGADRPEGKRWLTYEPAEGYALEAIDLEIRPSTTFVMQGAPNSNIAPASGEFAVSWVMYINFIMKIEDYGQFFLQLEPGWGDGVNPYLELFSNVNHNAHSVDGQVSLRKYWYEQYLLGKQLTLRCGVLRPMDWFDQNNYADDDDTEFLNWMFNNSPAIEWPSGYTFGEHAHMEFEAADLLELDLGHFEGNDEWQQLFRHGLYIGQVNIKPASLLGLDTEKWLGNYRFCGWVNNRDHSKFVEEGQTQGTGKYANYGFSLSFDQSISNAFDVFGRVSWQRPDLIRVAGDATVEWFWSGGIQVSGKYWQRNNDHIAFAVGQNFVSKEFNDAGNYGANEGHIETYYSCKLNSCLTVSPSVQLIWDPNGVSKSWQGDDEPVFVYSIRANYVF